MTATSGSSFRSRSSTPTWLCTRVRWFADNAEGTATVSARDAAVEVVSRNVRFRARATDADLVPGMVVTIDVPVGPARAVAAVPSPAVRREAGANVYVLVPAEEGATPRSVLNGAKSFSGRSGMA